MDSTFRLKERLLEQCARRPGAVTDRWAVSGATSADSAGGRIPGDPLPLAHPECSGEPTLPDLMIFSPSRLCRQIWALNSYPFQLSQLGDLLFTGLLAVLGSGVAWVFALQFHSQPDYRDPRQRISVGLLSTRCFVRSFAGNYVAGPINFRMLATFFIGSCSPESRDQVRLLVRVKRSSNLFTPSLGPRIFERRRKLKTIASPSAPNCNFRQSRCGFESRGRQQYRPHPMKVESADTKKRPSRYSLASSRVVTRSAFSRSIE